MSLPLCFKHVKSPGLVLNQGRNFVKPYFFLGYA